MNKESILDISWGSIARVAIAGIAVYITFLIRDVLIWFIFAVILSILLNPAVEFLEKRKIPRVAAVVAVYLGAFGALSFLAYWIISVLFVEIQQFSQLIPQYFETASPFLREIGFKAFENIESFASAMNDLLGKITGNLVNTVFAVFGGIFSTVFVLSMALFLSLEQNPIERTLSLLFPKAHEAYALKLWDSSRKKVLAWFLTRIAGCVFVGVLSYLAFLVFSTKYAFTLALVSGFLNFVPVVGPIITGVIIFAVASLDSVLMASFVLAAFTLIQQVENNILTPVLSKKFIGLSPVLVLIALVIGGELWGFMGAVLSVPLFGILYEFARDYLKKKKEEGW